MNISPNDYLPGDQRLVDKIVYELKSQGIFDQFRKECFADVDTKPAYQNLRQRVEGSVSGFLKEQSWRPDMNKNQVREMLRKTIFELGFLETGVERIVDQVVNPKINSVFLPKVEEVVYRYMGVQKPGRSDENKPKEVEPSIDLLPTDLEAVSPESDHCDKKEEAEEEQDKSNGSVQNLDGSKGDEDESPPFEPLDEPILPQEENSVDSHFSGYSGLVSHESGNDNKILDLCLQESQMSQNSSDSRLSTLASDENSKMDICEDTSKSGDFTKDKAKENHKSSSDKNRSDKDKDRKRSSHGKSGSSRDRSRDLKVSSKSDDKDRRDRRKSENDRNKGSSSSGNRHSSSGNKSSSNRDKSDTHRHDRDKYDKNKSHKDRDSKGKDKNNDSKLKSSTSKRDDKYYSSSKSKDKSYRKKDKDSKDDHYSLKNKIVDRRSTDRDSDGQSSKYSFSSSLGQSNTQSQKNNGQEQSSSNGNGDPTDHQSESTETKVREQKLKVTKPKYASNMQEAMKLMKIRRQLAKLEKQNQLSLATVEVNSTLMSSSINLDDVAMSHEEAERNKLKDMNNRIVAELETVPAPLPNTVISQNNWDEMEAKLLKEVCSEFSEVGRDESFEERPEETADRNNVKALECAQMEQPKEAAEEEKSETIIEEEILETEKEETLKFEEEKIMTNEEEIHEGDAVEADEENTVEASEENAVEGSEENAVEDSEENAVEDSEENAVESSEENVVEASEQKKVEEEAQEDNKNKASEEKNTNSIEKTTVVVVVTGEENIADEDETCKYFEEVDIDKIEFLQFVRDFLERNKDVSTKCTVKDVNMKEVSVKRKLEMTNNNNNMSSIGTGMPEKKRKTMGVKKTKQVPAVIDKATHKIVPLTSNTIVNGNEVSRPKTKSKAANNQRYSSDDLYKPRPSFSSSRRRGPKGTNI